MSLAGFTILETIIAMAIFAVAAVGVGGAIVALQQSWQKQKISINLINSARWGMEFMTNEIRRTQSSILSIQANPERLEIELPPGGSANEVRYWRGDGGTYGDQNIIYRGQGSGMSGANSNRKELVNFIDCSNAIFSVTDGLVTIDFTVKNGNSSFRLKTSARPKN